MRVFKAIIDGDSYSAIQWGYGKIKCSWRLMDWVEEVHLIAWCLQCTFHHMLREANDLVDGLAWEGVLS